MPIRKRKQLENRDVDEVRKKTSTKIGGGYARSISVRKAAFQRPFKWKDIHNLVLLLNDRYFMSTHLRDKFGPTLPNLLTTVNSIISGTNRKDQLAADFFTITCYLPGPVLYRKKGFATSLATIQEKMSTRLQTKRRVWSYTLFLLFTHALHRVFWRGEKFDEAFVKTHKSIARKWLELYRGREMIADYVSSDQDAFTTQSVKGDKCRTRLDLVLQFMIIAGFRIPKAVLRQTRRLLQLRHCRQTEHMYMLAKIGTFTCAFTDS